MKKSKSIINFLLSDVMFRGKFFQFIKKFPKALLNPRWAIDKFTAKFATYKTYPDWIKKNEPTFEELQKQRTHRFTVSPLLSVIIPTYNTPKEILIETIQSVLDQTYSNLEVCVAEASDRERYPYIASILEEFKSKDQRIKINYLSENKKIALNTNEGIAISSGEFILLLDHDDTLAPFALFEMVEAINIHPTVDFIYSDEDLISEDGKKRLHPFFKTDFSIDLLRSCNAILHPITVKRSLGDSLGWLRDGFNGAQDYDFTLRVIEKSQKIVHISKMLYHWRMSSASVSVNPNSKLYVHNAGKKALEEHLQRLNLAGEVLLHPIWGSYQVKYHIQKNSLISIIIANQGHYNTLSQCITSIVNQTTYSNYEIIIVKSNSTDKRLLQYYEEIGLNSRIKVVSYLEPLNVFKVNNYAHLHASGDVLLFLNSNTQVINSDWLERMVEHFEKQDVGIVGGKLFYPNNSICSAGNAIGTDGTVLPLHRNLSMDADGYFSRAKLIQNVSGVSGTCLMIRNDIFKQIGGFDEAYVSHYGDSDLCLKSCKLRYLTVWTPYALLYLHESKNTNYEAPKDKQLFIKKWNQYLSENRDPYYNLNLKLSYEHDFTINV